MFLKVLCADGTSLTPDGRVDYQVPQNHDWGPWITVGGKGAFCSRDGWSLDAGGWGPLLVEARVEGNKQESFCGRHGVECYSRISVRRVSVSALPVQALKHVAYLSSPESQDRIDAYKKLLMNENNLASLMFVRGNAPIDSDERAEATRLLSRAINAA